MSARTRQRAAQAALPHPRTRTSVAVYVRISKDRQVDGRGSRLGVTRQCEDCTAYAERLMLGTDVEVYDDNDRSGWDPEVTRPGFLRMLDDIRAGKHAAVIAWHPDRYTRQPMQLELLWSACQDSGTELHTVLGGQVSSMLALRIQGAVSAEESDIKSARTSRKHLEIAQAGGFPGGRRRYGYAPKMAAIVPAEAKVLNEVADRLLAGESLGALCRWLTAEGFPTAEGGLWVAGNLRQLLLRPHLAGLRIHDGEVYEAEWDAILERGKWEALQALLDDPARSTLPPTSTTRRYLLVGLAKCAVCGAGVKGRAKNKKRPSGAYACPEGHIHLRMTEVDRYVERRVLARLRGDDVTAAMPGSPAADAAAQARARIEALNQRLAEYDEDRDAGTLSRESYNRLVPKNEAKRKEAEADLRRAELAARRPTTALQGFTGPLAAAAWDAATLDQQRAILALLCTVQLRPASTHGRQKFATDDVAVTFFDDAEGGPQ